MRPFLKWAGGKVRLVERIKAALPRGVRLVEPFVGSGALFLNVEFHAYLLADANRDLINCYQQLQRYGLSFIDACAAYFTPSNNRPDAYYELRERFNAAVDHEERAALFVYLNRHGYNGLCRYNSAGGFNVPFGRYAHPYFPREEMIFCWQRSQRCEFVSADFAATLRSAVKGDVVYCDPPYAPLSATANFTSYSEAGFDLACQRQLAEEAHRAAQRGVPVVISNHDIPLTRDLYSTADRVEFFEVQRHISCDGTNRTRVGELLAVYEVV